MCLFDNLMYDNLMNIQHQAHSPSPPLIPLPLWLMLFFSQLAGPTPGPYFMHAGLIQAATDAMCLATAAPHSESSAGGIPPSSRSHPHHTHRAVPVASLSPLALILSPSWGCSLGQAGRCTTQDWALSSPEHPGLLGFSALPITLCKKKFLWPTLGAALV